MSTKIYNAYKFPKKLNIDELTKTVLAQRPLITIEAQKLYLNNYIRNFVKYYDECKLKPRKDINSHIVELNNKIEATSDDSLKIRCKKIISIYSNLLSNKYINAAIDIDSYIQYVIKPEGYKSSLLVIPCGSKLLAMTFGNSLLNDTLVNNLNLDDYHYQNQTDKPDNISSKAWETRRKTWHKAIGPDYVPINHGFEFNLVDENYIGLIGLKLYGLHDSQSKESENLFTKEFIKSLIPDIETRANMIVKTFKDYPNPPTEDSPYVEWLEYKRSDGYKKWKTKKIKQITKKLKNSDVFDILCNILGLE